MERFWKEYKTPMMKPGLREHMPKEETSRQQVTNSYSRSNRLDLPPTHSTRQGNVLVRHTHTKAMSDLRLRRQCTEPQDFTLFMKLTASN